MQASQFQKRSKPSKLGTIFRKSFLRYPSPKGNDEASFSFLSDVLSRHLCVVPHKLLNAQTSRTYVEIEVLSLGSSCVRYWPHLYEEKHEIGKPVYTHAGTIEISGHLSITSQHVNSLSLRFEGLYDSIVGEMYLIGCRDFQSFRKFIYNATKLEGGMDCLIEVKIKYPPRNARWLLNPKIKVSIISKRNEEDPLYLSPINLDTFLVSYKKKLDYVIFRKGFKCALRILLLTIAIICTLSQALYTRNKGHPIAYASFVMLGVHALSYTIPLITGDEVLFKWKAYRYYETEACNFEKFYRFQVLDFAIKTLLLVALLITVKLSQKVWESRSRQLAHAYIGKSRIPSDKLVFLITFGIHMVGFSIFGVISEEFIQPGNYRYVDNNIKKLLKWSIGLDKYSGLVQDFFLLPQIVGNTLWDIQGKPLRKSYYLGFTMVRVLLHMYNYVRDPVPNSENKDDEFQDLEFGLLR